MVRLVRLLSIARIFRVAIISAGIFMIIWLPMTGHAAPGIAITDEIQSRVAEFKSVNKYALIIGINKYEADNIPPLRFAVRDAKALYGVVTDPLRGGFPPESVTLLTDESDLPPTAANIGKSLRRIRMQAGEDDLVLVFFSGHGYEEEGRAYLLPRDADIEALDYTAVERDAFVRQIDGIVAKKVVVILDACHAGGISRGGKGAGKDAALSDRYYNEFLQSQGRAFIASCSGGQLSWEDEEAGHGVFTGSLISGLSGGADNLPEDGLVTLHELCRYLEDEVGDWAARYGRTQQPQVNLESAFGDIPVALNADYLEAQARQTEERRRTAEELKIGLVGAPELSAEELANAVALLDKLSAGEELTNDEKRVIGFIRKLVEGSIDTDMYRAGIRGLTINVLVTPPPKPPAPRYWFATLLGGGFLQAGEEFSGDLVFAPSVSIGYSLGGWALVGSYLLTRGTLESSTDVQEFTVHLITVGPRWNLALSSRVGSYVQAGVGGYLGSSIRNDQANLALDLGAGLRVGMTSKLSAVFSVSWILSNAALIPADKPELDQGFFVGAGISYGGE